MELFYAFCNDYMSFCGTTSQLFDISGDVVNEALKTYLEFEL